MPNPSICISDHNTTSVAEPLSYCALLLPCRPNATEVQLLDASLTITSAQARASEVKVYQKNRKSPKHKKVQTEFHSERQHTVLCMSHSVHPILPIVLDVAGMGANHIDECEVEPLTGPISFRPVGCCQLGLSI